MVSRYVVAAMGWAGTVLVVHALSPEGWGGYSLIFAVLGLVSLVTSLRLGRVVTSDILTAGEESGQVVGSYLTMRLVLGAISYVVAVSVVAALGYPAGVLEGAALAGVTLLFASESTALDLLLLARRWVRPVAVASVVGQFAQLLATVALVAGGSHNLLVLVAPALLYDGLGLVWRLRAVRHRVQIPFPRAEWSRWAAWFLEAVPLSIGSALNMLYLRIDTVIVSKIVGLAAVGQYAIGYKFAELIGFIPSALTATLLVTLVEAWPGEPDRFGASFRKAFVLVTVVAFGVAVEFGMFSAPLIQLFYGGRYVVAARATEGLVLGALLGFYTSLCFTALAAVKRNLAYPVAALIGVAVNVGLNLVLVPLWSYNGAALATVLTEVLVLAILAWAAARIPGIGTIPWAASTRALAAGIVMAAVAAALRPWTPWLVAAGVAAAVYAAGIHYLRVGGPGGLRDLIM